MRVRGVVFEKLDSLLPAGLGSRDRSLLEENRGIFLDSAGLGSRDRMPVLMVMLLLNFLGSAGLGSRDRAIVFVVVGFGVAGLGSRDRALKFFKVRLGSAGLGSRGVRVRTVGLGSRDRARFCRKLFRVFDGCLRYSVVVGVSLGVSLLAMVVVYPGLLLSTAGLGSLDRILFATAPPAGLGSLALARFGVRLVEEFVRVAGLGSLDFSLATPAFPYRVVKVTGGALSFLGFVTVAFFAASSLSFAAPYLAAINADRLISFGLSFSSSASSFLEVSISRSFSLSRSFSRSFSRCSRSLSRSRRLSSSLAFSRSFSFSFSAAMLEYRLMYVDTFEAVDLGDRYVPEVNEGR